MQFEVLHRGAYAMVKASLRQGEAIRAESDAMVAMSETIDVEGKMEGGMWKAFKRKALGGESAFLQILTAARGDGDAYVAPATPGDVEIIELHGSNEYFVQKDGFLAAEKNVNIDAVSQGFFKGVMSGEGMFVQKASGTGKLVISSFGSIHKMSLAPGQKMVVDNGHLVAWSGSVQYEIRKASSGWVSSMTSGEGFVCHVEGPGDVYIQTRNPGAFGAWLRGFMPTSR